VGWAIVVGCLALPTGAAGQGLAEAAETEVTIDLANHVYGGIGFGGPIGVAVGTDPGLGYLGPELDLSIVRVNTTLGVLWRVSGSGGKSVLFSWGLGFGF
jgi:hypothetical protein